MKYATYLLETGRILSTTTTKGAPPRPHDPLTEAVVAVEGEAHPDTHYIDLATSTALSRPVMPIVADKIDVNGDGIDDIRLSGIPEGATIALQEDTVVAEADGVFIGTVELPGTYMLSVSLFPYQEWRTMFDAR